MFRSLKNPKAKSAIAFAAALVSVVLLTSASEASSSLPASLTMQFTSVDCIRLKIKQQQQLYLEAQSLNQKQNLRKKIKSRKGGGSSKETELAEGTELPKDREMCRETIRQIVADQLGVDLNEVNENSNFSENLGADSLDWVELVMRLEDRFKITIKDEEADQMRTVKEGVERVWRLCIEQHPEECKDHSEDEETRKKQENQKEGPVPEAASQGA